MKVADWKQLLSTVEISKNKTRDYDVRKTVAFVKHHTPGLARE